MHTDDKVAQALELFARGLSTSDVARRIGVPRGTVQDWRKGGVPRRVSDESCAFCRGEMHDFAALPPEYVYLLGLYLGDGSIATHARGVYKLRVNLDAKYPGIIEDCVSAMSAVVPANKVSTFLRPCNDVEVYAYSKSWPCFFPQHGRGKKHDRAIILDNWQQALVAAWPELLLRGLIQSDGCRFINTGRKWRSPRYSFTNLSEDIREIFIETCERLGLHATTSKATVYVSKKADVAYLDTFVGPKA